MDTSMTHKHVKNQNESSAGLTRRNLLRGSVTLGLAAMIGSALPWQSVLAAQVSSDDFIALSQFLVSRAVNPVLAGRYYAALDKRAPNFSTNVIALKQLIGAQGYRHVDEYLAQPNPDPSLRATATSIISAWYLGIVGEPADAELISYSLAMMYQPTHGILIIPTYGGGPDSWGPKPSVIQDSTV
ncbi:MULTISPECIES: sugar dehydrogenase complex small subunit [Pseudomonas]|uniref:Putative dehydrogenase subunit n=1 Tax=Pseudomonas fluorescens (strain Pf0-1) TaxID=205922 RepID=Q3K8A3_PSEPF|nr:MULTISPECIES: sugar dehydrogenase complex small subunit [Pseudomonas]ABA76001.1 putative dehydrogenase subunit [Pseudomonas fluorescens Pf0-1]MBL0793855.1 sorbitol dehydrogenase family protein [Pseudomonas sp. B7]MBY9023931.1 sorbitol dehydrogenase family protein [Pseudomonas fluorescens]MBY9033415.1 sorbitol dehydrogenase family protein [Pseudomonas fluorescens]MBY9036152.1 sorbitol dehydrogenase family protein [Pseudomonas fluorescens]